MHIITSTHQLTLTEDHVYNLRKLGVAGDDSWLESRRGEAFDRKLKVSLDDTQLNLFFEGKPIGSIPLTQKQQVSNVFNLVAHWNEHIGPTDLQTVKTMELVKDWPRLLTRKPVKTRCVTFNSAGILGEMAPKRDTWVNLLGPNIKEDDIIVLAFQETDSLNRSVKANALTLQTVCNFTTSYLFNSHSLVSSVQLVGLMTLVFVRQELVSYVSRVSTDTSSTGLLKVWGNKGAVLTRFSLYRDEIIGGGIEIDVVNCHLSAGEGITQLGRRKWELREIGAKFGLALLGDHVVEDSSSVSSMSEDDLELSEEELKETAVPQPKQESPQPETVDSESSNIDEEEKQQEVKMGMRTGSKYTILLGDLNYRVLLSSNEARRKVQAKEWEGLLAADSLLLERHEGLVFGGFEEAKIAFPPTYKYKIGTSQFSGRVPSYTDRILYRSTCSTKLHQYNSVDLKDSDHRPVSLSATIDAQLCIDPEKRDVVLQRVRKIADTAENNARPKLDVDEHQLILSGAPFSVQTATFSICNDGSRPVQWVIENAMVEAECSKREERRKQAEENDDEEESEEEESEHELGPVRITRDSLPLTSGGDVAVTPGEGKVGGSQPKCGAYVEARIGVKPRDLVLLVHPRPHDSSNADGAMVDTSVQKYVLVRIEPTKSILGSPVGDEVSTPVKRCVEYLRTRPAPRMFVTEAEPRLFQQVMNWLDSDKDLDTEVLGAANEVQAFSGVYAVAQVLLMLFQYSPEPVLGPSQGETKSVLPYLCKFLRNVDEPSINAWADALYDKEDHKAGKNEKRAYLRSEIIANDDEKTDDEKTADERTDDK